MGGNRLGGARTAADALSRGASGVVVSRKVESKQVTIRVEDTLVALGELAAYYRSTFDPTVIGVTGSVGKTTTREMIAAVVAARGPVLKSAGNPKLMTAGLVQTLAEHAAGNLRLLMNLANDLLTAGLQQERDPLDEKLFLEVFQLDPKPNAKRP